MNLSDWRLHMYRKWYLELSMTQLTVVDQVGNAQQDGASPKP